MTCAWLIPKRVPPTHPSKDLFTLDVRTLDVRTPAYKWCVIRAPHGGTVRVCDSYAEANWWAILWNTFHRGEEETNRV